MAAARASELVKCSRIICNIFGLQLNLKSRLANLGALVFQNNNYFEIIAVVGRWPRRGGFETRK